MKRRVRDMGYDIQVTGGVKTGLLRDGAGKRREKQQSRKHENTKARNAQPGSVKHHAPFHYYVVRHDKVDFGTGHEHILKGDLEGRLGFERQSAVG